MRTKKAVRKDIPAKTGPQPGKNPSERFDFLKQIESYNKYKNKIGNKQEKIKTAEKTAFQKNQ